MQCPQCQHVKAAVAKAPAPHVYTPKHLADKVLTSKVALEGERKQVTVLFCDIVESSRLAERLGPEAMHEVMDRALRLMAEAFIAAPPSRVWAPATLATRSPGPLSAAATAGWWIEGLRGFQI